MSREGPGRTLPALGPRAVQAVSRLDIEPSSPRSVWMPQCTPTLPQSLVALGPFLGLTSTKEGHCQEEGEQQKPMFLVLWMLFSMAPTCSPASSRIARGLMQAARFLQTRSAWGFYKAQTS